MKKILHYLALVYGVFSSRVSTENQQTTAHIDTRNRMIIAVLFLLGIFTVIIILALKISPEDAYKLLKPLFEQEVIF